MLSVSLKLLQRRVFIKESIRASSLFQHDLKRHPIREKLYSNLVGAGIRSLLCAVSLTLHQQNYFQCCVDSALIQQCWLTGRKKTHQVACVESDP